MSRVLWLLPLALVTALGWPASAGEYEPGDSVWIRFGNPDQSHGLYLLEWDDESPLVIRGGRYGRVSRRDTLHFRVDPRFLHEPMPIRVIVDYWDESTDWFMLRYGSSDTYGDRRGEQKHTPVHRRTDTGTWKQVVFRLPDARFSGNAWNRDFSVCQDYWTGGERHELIVSRVEVIKGGVALSASPEVISADRHTTATIEARVYDRTGTFVPDGTRVEFTCTRGTVEPHVTTTVGGCAIAAFTGDIEPGSADVTATALDDSATVVVPMLEGKGPIHEVTYVLDDFSHPERWSTRDTDDWEGKLSLDELIAWRGRPVAKWEYRYKRSAFLAIPLAKSIPTPGRLKRLSIWVNHDGSGNGIDVFFHDAAGAAFHWELGGLWGRGWRWHWQDLGQPWERPEDTDFRITWPITFDRIAFAHWKDTPDVGEVGVVYFQDLTAICLVPESSLVWPELRLAIGTVEKPGHPVPCDIRVHNLSDRPHSGLRLEVAMLDRGGRTVATRPTAFALEPGEVTTFDHVLRPRRHGQSTIEVRVRGEGVDSVARAPLVVGMAEP